MNFKGALASFFRTILKKFHILLRILLGVEYAGKMKEVMQFENSKWLWIADNHKRTKKNK